jgi:uncharacterized protein GlcG (DUF336 family)
MGYDLDRLVRQVIEQLPASSAPTSKPSAPAPLTLAQAKRLAAYVEEQAAAMGVRAVVSIADAGGNPILTERTDGAYLASYDIAQNKAYTSVALQTSTAALASLAAPGGSLYGIQFTNNGRIVIFGGGDPLRRGGVIVGGLGVSGGSAEQDTALSALGRDFFEAGNC